MSGLETSHNGHKITYAENEDVWRCWDMDLEAKTLSALKARMNKLDADARRVGNVAALRFNSSYGPETLPCHVTMLDGEDEAWVVGPKYLGRSANARQKVKLSELLPDTPETRLAIAAMEAKTREARALAKEAEAMRAAIPRLTVAALKNLPEPTE